MKKILSIILSLSLLISCLPLSSNAETGNMEVITVSAEEAKRRYEESKYYLSDEQAVLSDENYEEFEQAVYESLKNHEPKIDIKKYGYTFSDENILINDYLKIITSHPELYYVETTCGYSGIDNTFTNITPAYLSDFNGNNNQFDPKYDTIFENKVNEIYNSVIQTEMEDDEKALALFDYFVNNVTYDHDTANSNNSKNQTATSFTAYGAIVNGSAVCQGYSLAYGLLMDKCGIEWKYVSSDSMNHAWDMIKLDDKWYHVDVTWGDGFEQNQPNLIAHEYFLRSDKTFMTAENPDDRHHDWDDTLPKCNSKKYEATNYPFNKKEQDENFLGLGSYIYNNGYFYVKVLFDDNTFTKYAKVTFDGSTNEEITKEEYENAIPKITITPTQTPDITAAPLNTAEPTTKPISTEKPHDKSYTIEDINYAENGDLVVSITNNVNRNNNDKLIAAAYDDKGQMCGVSLTDITDDNDGNITISNPITDNSTTLKILIWDNFTDLNILAPSVRANITE